MFEIWRNDASFGMLMWFCFFNKEIYYCKNTFGDIGFRVLLSIVDIKQRTNFEQIFLKSYSLTFSVASALLNNFTFYLVKCFCLSCLFSSFIWRSKWFPGRFIWCFFRGVSWIIFWQNSFKWNDQNFFHNIDGKFEVKSCNDTNREP